MNWYYCLTLGQDGRPAPPTQDNTTSTNDGPVQTTEGQPANGEGPALDDPPATSTGGGAQMIFMIVLFVLIFYLLILLPQRRERKRHQELVTSLAKGDKVVTSSGIIGTVVEVRPHELVVKVDESSNTRMRFVPDAIRSKIDDRNDGGAAVN